MKELTALDWKGQNKKIQDAIIKSIEKEFPLESNNRILKLENPKLEDKVSGSDIPALKDIKLKRGSYKTDLYGSVSLIDKKTGKVIDKSNKLKIANIPKMTRWYSMLIDGNEYQPVNQLRLKSGIYTRIKDNGDLESRFNLEKGFNFTMILPPERGIIYLVTRNAKYRLYNILYALGVEDSVMKEAWGKELFDKNKRGALNTEQSDIIQLYKELTKEKNADYSTAVEGLANYLDSTRLSEQTTKVTLGKSYRKVTPETLLAASKKLINVMKEKEDPDERESLLFKDLYSVEDLATQYFDKNKENLTRKIKYRMDKKDKVNEVLSSSSYTKPIKSFFTQTDLASTTEQTNPAQIISDAQKVTFMGTGGIGSRHAITKDIRDLHPSHLNFLDPLATPECQLPDTLVLTLGGWVRAKDITMNHKVGCNISGSLEFNYPDKVKSYDYKGDLYIFNNSKIKQSVTQNHRLWVRPLDKRSRLGYRIELASDVYGKDRLMQMGHEAYVGDNSFTSINIPDDNNYDIVKFSKFLGWFLSEGNARQHTQSKSHYISKISQSKLANPENYKEIENILKSLNIKYTACSDELGFNIRNSSLSKYLSQFGKCNNKHIPKDLFNAPLGAREELFDSLLKGDGRRTDPRYPNKINWIDRDVYTTTSASLAEDFQVLASTLGFATSINSYADLREERFLNIYEVRLLMHPETQILNNKVRNDQIKIKDYTGKVIGISVPGGLLYVKEERYSPVWTGNSGKAGVNLGMARDILKDGHDMKTSVRMPDGSRKFLSVQEFYDTVVGFGDQYAIVNKKPIPKSAKIRATHKGKPKTVSAKDVEAWMMSPSNMFSYTTNTIPYMANDSGNRVAMATRMMGQAIPIKNREAPYVQTRWKGNETFQKAIGNFMNPAPGPDWSGKVSKIDKDYVHIDLDKPDKKGNKKVKVGLAKNYPLNQESFLDNEVKVKVGDKVTPNKYLAESNFTKDGTLSLGANTNVAYMPWKGLTFEDSAVVSDSFAKKFTSEKITKKHIFLSKQDELNLQKFRGIFPDVLTSTNAKKLDTNGLVKEGTTVQPGDIIAAYVTQTDMSDEERVLKQMNRAIAKPYKKRIVEWDDDFPGEVLYVMKKGRNVDIHVKVKSPLVEGDKLCVDEKTEILTKNGWKTIINCNLSDKFCTLNPDNHKIEYQYADKINIYEHSGKMYHIKNSLIDQLVTLNHKMYVKPRNKNSYKLIPAKKIKNKRVKYLKNGLWEGNQNIVPDSLQNIFDDETYASFLGWYLSEGSNYISKKGYVITISQSKEKNKSNYNKIVTLLEKCNLTPLKGEESIRFNSKAISLYVKQFGLSHEKFIPKNLKNASSHIINIFLESFGLGDGHLTKTNQWVMTTSSLTLRDNLMELFLKAGYSSTYVKSASKGDFICGNPVNYDIWNIRQIRTKNTPQVNNGHSKKQNAQTEEIINYTGKVGCPTTKNGIIYIRRNGKTVWTGNSGLHGNKAIVSEIVPDDKMPHTVKGERMDMIFSPVTVPGRMNIGQIVEAAAGKLVDKTDKKPLIIDNFVDKDQIFEINKKLKENNIPAEEVMLDGKDGKPFEKPVFWGKPYILKLKHVVDHKLKSRNIGSYDINMQPARGKESGQTMGSMEAMAMLSHGAKENLYEATAIKGQKNDEYWRNLQLGLPTPAPKANFAFDKMLAYLKQSGVNVEKDGDKFTLMPMTDKEVSKISNGKVTDGGQMLIAKNLKTIKGGLFDPEIFGGSSGRKWGHIELAEKIPNPMMEDAIIKALDITKPRLEAIIEGEESLNGLTGFKAIEKALGDIDVDKKIKNLKKELSEAPEQKVNVLNKKIRYLEALKKLNLSPKDYMIKKVPILPPEYRPIYPLPSGDLMVSPINKHYRDVSLINDSIKKIKENDLDDDFNKKNKVSLYKSVKSLQGLMDPITYTQEKYEGSLKSLAGKSPKYGFIQDRLFSKKQDMSARSTVGLDPSLNIDEVGLPEDMTKKLFKPFVMRKLVQTGMKAVDANRAVNDWTPDADKALDLVIKERPVLLNRAPTLHKHSIQAFKTKRVPGKTIKTNPLINSGFNLDFDGDCLLADIQAVIDFKGSTFEKLIISDLNLDFDKFIHYIISRGINLTKRQKMILKESYINYVNTKTKTSHNIHISEIPYYENKITKETENIIEYEVPDFIKVFAVENGKQTLKTVTRFSIHKNLKMFKVTTGSKREVIASSDHSLICYDPVKEKLSKFKPEKAIGLLTPLPLSLDLTNNINKKAEEGWFVGCIVGDGWIDSLQSGKQKNANKVMLSNSDKNIIEASQRFLNNKGYSITNTHDFNGHTCTSTKISWSDKSQASYFRKEIGSGAANKHLPRNFLNTSENYRFGLLSGLIDTDGSICIVKAVAKNKPQYIANYATISKELHYQIQQLCASLGIRTSVNIYEKNGHPVYHITFYMNDLVKYKNKFNLKSNKKRNSLNSAFVSVDRKSIVPISYKLANTIQKKLDNKTTPVLYAQTSKAKKTGTISKKLAKELCSMFRLKEKSFKVWKKEVVNNNNLTWDIIKSIEPSSETVGYDLTVPGPYTFMTSNLLLVQDTMAVHVPLGNDAVNEAWNMLPSKNIFKHGDNAIVPELSQEYQFGLYWLTKEGKNTGLSFTSLSEAKKAGLSETDVFTLNGKKTTLGKETVNSTIPKKYRNYKEPFTQKVVNEILTKIAKEDPNNFPGVINSFKDLGHKYAHSRSSTISINDFTQPRSYRDKILKDYAQKVKKVKKDEDKTKLWLEASEKVRDAQDKYYKGKSNVYDWLESGGLSGSKAPNAMQILSMPGVVSDVRGKPIKEPILKSFGEGLDSPDYWNTMFGVRKGIIDTAVSTSGPGALSKALMGNVWDTVISEEDCGTRKYIELEVKGNEKDIIDRCLAENITGIGKKDDIIDSAIYNKLKKSKIKSVKVRSPLTCESTSGICQKCYGILPTGQFPDIGYNVGIADAQAVTEKSTQLALRTKHTGAAFAGGGKKEQNIMGGFDRAVQLLEVPETVPYKAILSPHTGVVEEKKKDPLGGWNLKISGKKVNVPSGKKVLVNVGSFVKRGDKLSEGFIKPQELSKLKDHMTAQRQVVDEFDDLYQNDYHKKTFETILRAISNNAKIEENPEKSEYIRGDTTTIQNIERENKLRKERGLNPIKYTPYFKSISVLPQDREDWLSRVGTNRIVQAIKDSASRGAATNIHGNNPIPAYLYGVEFGKKKDTTY